VLDVYAEARSAAGGLGADADANDDGENWGARIGRNHANTLVEIQGSADLHGDVVQVVAQVPFVKAVAVSRTRATALGADSDAGANAEVHGLAEVRLKTTSFITGDTSVLIKALYDKIDVYANPEASCACGGGDTDSRAYIRIDTNSKVAGEDFSRVKTAHLDVQAYAFVARFDANADSHAPSPFDFGSEDNNDDASRFHPRRTIFWESTVFLLGEPNPVLEVDATGKIVLKTWNVYVKAYNPATDTYSALLDVNDTIPAGQWIVVGDLLYDESSFARFEANDVNDDNKALIFGNAGEFYVQHTWDSVLITNYSDRRLVINDIDAVDGINPNIEIAVDNITGPTNSPANADPLQDDDPSSVQLAENNGAAFEFDILHKFPRTDVQIRNLQPGAVANSDVYLDGDIENPIGRTYVKNERGNIFSDNAADLEGIESNGTTLISGHQVSTFDIPGSDTDYELIRTNHLELDADAGSIGRQAAGLLPRVPVAAELIRFKHIDPAICSPNATPCLFDIVVQVEAAGDLVVDLTANERSLASDASSIDVQIDYLRAGNDIDVVVNDSIQGQDLGDTGYVLVELFDPPSNAVIPSGAGGIGSFTDAKSGNYIAHFRPDITPQNYEFILRAFGTAERDKVTSTYTFGDAGNTYGDVRAEDDIKICHVPSRNYSDASDFGSAAAYPCETRNPATLTYSLAAATATVNFVVFTDVNASLTDLDTGSPYAAPFELDDGIGTDVAQIFLFTNGNVTDTELNGDLLAGHIESTAADVTLFSPVRILDADRTPTIDVTGVNITMTAGTAGGVGGIGYPTVNDPNAPDPASPFNLGGYLEINVDRNNAGTGVVDADDTASNDGQTFGIYLDEIVGSMRVGEIETAGTAGDLSTGNVSLRTIDGSIVDGANDSAADVLGQTIDLDANGGSLGEANNDLDINSSRGSNAPCTATNCADVDPDGSGPALPTTNPGLGNDNDDVALEATQNIYVTETDAYLRLVFAHAVNGDIRITVRESADLDEDLYLIEDGSARFAESNVRAPSFNDVDSLRIIPAGQVFAETGNVTLRIGDDAATHQNSKVLANGDIDVFRDFGDADAGWGTNVILRGRIVADCVVTKGPDSGDPMGSCSPETAVNPAHTTEIWGENDVDTFQLGDPSGANSCSSALAGCSTAASSGYIFLGSKTFIRGGEDLNPAGDGAHDPSVADGEDRFIVWYLQSMDVTPYGVLPTADGAGHDLTLDGQADSDFYYVYATGSRGDVRHYVINILDTGAEADGSDQAFLYGLDNTATEFNGYQQGSTTERNPNDDVFLLRRVLCIDTQAPYAVDSAGACLSSTSSAHMPAFVAVLHGDLDGYRDAIAGNEASNQIQRINYDAALNGRLSVYGRGGNDYFFVDDNSAITTLDGGFGYDTFQVGQIFGLKRDCFMPDSNLDGVPESTTGCGLEAEDAALYGTAGGGLKPQDVFPDLIATTRGWLSPGTHAPLVATGGTGNDEFIVYSNQHELRLEGDDDNDLFIIRAFALAVVCDTDANSFTASGDDECDSTDIDDPYGHDQTDPDGAGPLVSDTNPGDHTCDAPVDPDKPLIGARPRLDNQIDGSYDGVCNAADAHTTPQWWDDEIIFDCKDALPSDPGDCSTGKIVARPIIGGGFSIGKPLDVRTGGGDDEVQYNVNAPVSVDGGTGFDKLVVLGTEFADDIVITLKGVFGAGLNVRYARVEVVEVDGLEGDDEFFVQSTAFGVAYRVIGGLGSDTINVTGDVSEDIIVRDLEGVSGTVDHLVTSDDRLYNGLIIDGIGLNVATDELGLVVIEESDGFTSVRENGTPAGPSIDDYVVYLSTQPSANVYVTVSAAREPQEEADDTFANPAPLPNGSGDTVWLCVGTGAAGECDSIGDFQRMVMVNGVLTTPENRAFVLTFTPGNYATKQYVYIWAVDEDTPGHEIDPRSEGDRVHVIQHSVLSADARFDGVAVRNVEALIRDNDTPGIYVTQVEILGNEGAHTAGVEDQRTIVIEGKCIGQNLIPGNESFCAANQDYTGLLDIILVELAKELESGQVVVVDLILDEESAKAVTLVNLNGDSRFVPLGTPVLVDAAKGLWRLGTLTFDDTNWNVPVQVGVRAYNDISREDPAIAVIAFQCAQASFAVCGQYNDDPNDAIPDNPSPYPFPNLRSGPGLLDIEVIDDETPGGVPIESGGSTLVVSCSPAPCVPLTNDEYTLRLTRQPDGSVKVAILTDGLTDVVSVDGNAPTIEEIGGYIPAQQFSGNIVFGHDGNRTLTRGSGADLGSFIDEGFRDGMFIQIAGAGAGYDGNYYIDTVSDDVITLTDTTAWAAKEDDVILNRLTRQWKFEGKVAVRQDSLTGAFQLERFDQDGSLILGDELGWLSDGFLEGQVVRICDAGAVNCVDAKIALIRGDNKAFDTKLQFTLETGSLPWAVGTELTGATVIRIAPVVTFTGTDWYVQQKIELAADPWFEVPVTREGSKYFPVSAHLLSKLRGPLAVEGGVTGADRSLKTGLKLPGELDAGLFEIGPQPPESQQIDVLNIFNDSSQQDRDGVMTSTNLSGFGMAKDLDFGGAAFFGEPNVFPGGISFGTISFVDGHFETDGAKSTIEVLNLLLGKGNDHVDIQGTLDPAPPVSALGTVDIDPAAGGGTLTRIGVATWEEFGFFVGQPVTIEGLAGEWTVASFSQDGKTMTLAGGPALPDDTDVYKVIGNDKPVDVTGPVTVTPIDGVNTDGGTVSRPNFDWKAAGFLVGQLVMIGGLEPEVFRIIDMTDSADADDKPDVLTLRGDVMDAGLLGGILGNDLSGDLRLYVPGVHGGLTVVHGGGNFPLENDGPMAVANDANGAGTADDEVRVTRTDGFDWTDDGYAVGQWIQIGAEGQTHKIVAFEDFTCPPPPPDETAIPNCGQGSVMVLGGLAGATGTFADGHVHVAEPLKEQVTAPMEVHTNFLKRTDLGSFVADGFEVGQQVWIEGLAGPWTLTGVTADTLTLSGAALTPTVAIVNDVTVWSAPMLTVFGYDVLQDGGVRIGGDELVVCNPNVQPVCTAATVVGGPDSPLVLYGDTSQDGVWYSGHPYDILGAEFGEKPFDPFVNLPDDDNEDDEWVFPLADPFPYHGNDVIDASGLFAWIDCAVSCTLPTLGVTAYGGRGNDLIIGSQTGDHLAGGSGDDEIVGNRGVDHVYGDGGFNVNVLTRALTVTHTDASPLPTLDLEIIRFTNEGETIEPYPSPVRDTLLAGRDLICGDANALCRAGLVAMSPAGPESLFDDIVFGDHGQVFQHVIDPNTPDALLQKIQTTLLESVLAIESRNYQNGDDDTIFGNLGRDVLVGGDGDDMVDGDEADDMVFGDNVFLLRRTGTVDPQETDIPLPGQQGFDGDVTSGRFQTLCGTLLYSRTDRPNACGGPVGQDDSGQLLVDGVWRDYRDPDTVPWWAEYAVSYDYDFTDEDPFHSFEVQNGQKGAGSFGNDYLAGSQAHDLLFGQMGNDVIQGDGGIEDAFARPVEDSVPTTHAGASRTPDGCSVPAGGGLICDYIGDLDIVPSFEAATDGQDYIEGNAGDDVIFGNLGQDDIVGGSSEFFSLNAANHPASGGAELRPDGDDLVFGGAGTRTGRNDDSHLGTADVDHARDADTIATDNADVIRIVGLNHLDGQGVTAPNKYVIFNYDNYGAMRLIVRGVAFLDYTPGGPDFDPGKFFPGGAGKDPACSSAGAGATGECSTPVSSCTAYGGPYADIGGHDEAHGESGDDTIYTQCGHDIAFGDAQNDDLIGGWGNDFLSGGTGQDGILGDDGRIFTSRNSASGVNAGGSACQGGYVTVKPGVYQATEACFSEPLYGVAAFVPTDPDTKSNQGFVLNEFIYTPGQVQTATINVGGQYKKEFDITPYNLGPNLVAGHFQVDLPLYDANNSDDVIFGGWDDDFLHGASGDDAISGAEALPESYVQHFDGGGQENGLVRVDWTRPWNRGNLLLFGADSDPWNAPKPFAARLGEFYLYDEYDARREVQFDANGAVWGCTAFSNSGHTCLQSPPLTDYHYEYFLNLVETTKAPTGTGSLTSIPITEGRETASGCILVANNGTCLQFSTVNTDGNDIVMGDLGNDWMVGGSGQDDIYSGWGNDLANADDILTTDGSLNDATDTHPTYADRVYGGAGIDILIGNTYADRLIDWVGEWNSYIVPFSAFGIVTVSRQVEPQLPEFLYALSASDGADPTRDTDTGADVTRPGRNGEYEGEMGLIIQQDHGYWQQQTGGPTDPQPGNIPGGPRDRLAGADFNSGSLSGFAPDSGVWEVSKGTLSVGAASQGGDAAAVFYHGEYLPIYYEIQAQIQTQKPTGGWKANAYIIFDYFSPTDFKFAGINVSTNKIEMGHRTASGWIVDVQSTQPVQIKPGTFYTVLVAVNGTTVTVRLDSKVAFTYTFAPRVLNGENVGLNKGLIGMGSDNSRGVYDNVAVQVLPPNVTLDTTETFDDGVADLFTGAQSGTWTAAGGRYASTAPSGTTTFDTIDFGLDRGLLTNSYLEVQTTLRTSGIGGVIFDQYKASDYKFFALDVTSQKVIVGHVAPRGGWIVDASASRSLIANRDYDVVLVFKGTSLSIQINGAFIFSFAFNSPLVDGAFGVLSRGGTTSFNSYRIRTNDPAFASPAGGMTLEASVPAPQGSLGTLDESALRDLAARGLAGWREELGAADPRLGNLEQLRLAVADLADGFLGQTIGRTVYLDADAGGYGWEGMGAFGAVDPLAVIVHELGHVLGLDHDDAKTFVAMSRRYLLAAQVSAAASGSSSPAPAREAPAAAALPERRLHGWAVASWTLEPIAAGLQPPAMAWLPSLFSPYGGALSPARLMMEQAVLVSQARPGGLWWWLSSAGPPAWPGAGGYWGRWVSPR